MSSDPKGTCLYLEPVGGIAGDMFLAAAMDLGVRSDAISQGLASLKVPGWKLAVRPAQRHQISGTHVDVELAVSEEHVHRTLPDIRTLIRQSALPARAQERAQAVFQALGEAEAKIHGTTVDEVHFHEVGAVDSIIDICGAALVLELLGDPKVYASPPPLGSGTVRAAHGVIPIPAPATLELLRDLPVRFEGVGELTTPTGAALLKVLAHVGAPPEMVVERVGYGVGTKDFADRPNVLRASLGRLAHGADTGTFVVEANLDDCSPQLLGGLFELLLQQGALDVYVVPVTMKKSRPGHVLGVLAPGDKRDALISTIVRETTTLGVRFHRVERFALERRFEEVQTRFGKVRIKLALERGQVVNASPEYEDCRARAAENNVSAKQVWAEALAAYHR